MAHDTSSPLAGILMTAFFGIISTVIAAITMYQVHNIWVRYHLRRQENGTVGAHISLKSKFNYYTPNRTDLI